MKVRIFSAANMQDALNQVKETLGRDAIILHTRKFRKGGIGGFFGTEMVEVMAAVDNELPAVTVSAPQPKPKAKSARYKTRTPVRSLLQPSEKSKNYALELIDSAQEIIDASEKADDSKGETLARPVLEPLTVQKIYTDKVKVQQPSAEENQGKKSRQVETEQELKSEISGMRKMLEQLLSKTKTTLPHTWYDYLIKKEIIPIFAEEIIDSLPEKLKEAESDPEAVKSFLAGKFIEFSKTTGGIHLNGVCKKVALVGPTGVGKTTTLAKLAAKFALENNTKVAFITADTYRIAAVEQLRTYANILNIPLDVVYSSEDMKACLEKHQDKELVLIDTAGRSPNNQEQLAELASLLAIDEQIEAHLVLSSTTKHQDAKEVIEKFSPETISRLIFTKIDEAKHLGNIFSILYEYPALAVSYITDGQSVPDDIHPAQPEHLTELFFRSLDG